MGKLALEYGGGLKGLPIGSSVEDVRTFFGNGHQPFERSHDSGATDYWPSDGVFAYYDAANLLEALEFSTPSDPTLSGLHLTTTMMREAMAHLRSLDPGTRFDASGATSTKLGVGVWSSTGDPDQPVGSVITFGTGYYD